MPTTLDAAVLHDTLSRPAGPWSSVEVHEVVGSTNAMSVADPRSWRVMVAGHQETGKGRHARAWSSPPGTSVSMSMTVPLPPRPGEWGWIPLVTGLAVREALAVGAGLEVGLKWPNDVLVRGREAAASDREPRKVCGILCEGAGELVVVGVGVNVTSAPEDLPVPTATSLAIEGAEVSREEVVVGIARRFASLFGRLSEGGAELDAVRAAYREACTTLGAEVAVHLPGGEIATGRAVDVDADGRLVVESGGRRVAHAAGDVVHVRRAERA